jgi:hypothetical protein
MMAIESKDRIGLTVRAAMIARELLEFTRISNKLHARLTMRQVYEQLQELNEQVEGLPAD